MKKYRSMLMLGAVLVGVLAACAPEPIIETVEVPVEKTVEVPVQVEVTKIVEVEPEVIDYGLVTFISTQGVPIEEAEAMRGVVLADFAGQVEFIGSEYEHFEDLVLSEVEAGAGTIDVTGALYGQYPTLVSAGALQDIGDLMAELSDRGIPAASIELGKLGTDTQYYVPWMQATYIAAASKEALPYLPAGADVNSLTWEQFRDWGKNIF